MRMVPFKMRGPSPKEMERQAKRKAGCMRMVPFKMRGPSPKPLETTPPIGKHGARGAQDLV